MLEHIQEPKTGSLELAAVYVDSHKILSGTFCGNPFRRRTGHHDCVFANGGDAIKLSKDAAGAISATEVYFSSTMQNHHGGMIVIDGCLYGANGGNEGGFLTCLDFKTGNVLWRDRQAPKGSLTLADGLVCKKKYPSNSRLLDGKRQQGCRSP